MPRPRARALLAFAVTAAVITGASCGEDPPSCKGEPIACDHISGEGACLGQQGCRWEGPTCTGTTAFNCHVLDGRQDLCQHAGRCSWGADSKTCSGEPDIHCSNPSNYPTQEICEAFPGCRWDKSHPCAGYAPATCAQATYDTACGKILGCEWQ